MSETPQESPVGALGRQFSLTDELPENITGQVFFDGSWGTEKDLGEDAYAAAIVAIVRNATVISLKRSAGISYGINTMRLSVSMAVMVANLVLQGGLLYYIRNYVVEPAVREAQVRYHHFHSHVYASGHEFDQDSWDDYEWKDEVCQLTMVNPIFFYCMLFLWTLSNMQEWRQIERLLRVVMHVDSCVPARDMLVFVDTRNFKKEGRCYIVALTNFVRIVLCLIVILPRAVIAMYLQFLGCRWLSASGSLGDMVLNSLALAFVINIDDTLYHAVLPIATRKQIAETKFFQQQPQMNLEKVEKNEFKGYKRTALWISVCFAWLFLYGAVIQSVLPSDLHSLAWRCRQHTLTSMTPLCNHWTWSGASRVCYPYGPDGVDVEPQHNR